MRLDKIKLENFRQYYGQQKLSFARDSQKPVTVIHGVNGAGKTSFFLAINWCLYGSSSDNIKVVENVGELVSKEAVARAKPGELVQTKVELSFTHEGERYSVRRTLQGTKQLINNQLAYVPEEFIMQRIRNDGQAERINNPVGVINSILPVNVREYFLFDGEKIDNFAKPKSASQVREAIYLVLKLEILERGHKHLDVAAQEYRRTIKQESAGELRNLIEQEEKKLAEIETNEKHKTELEEEMKLARQKVSEIEQQLLEMQAAGSLQKERDRIARDLQEREKERGEVVAKLKDLASSSYLLKLKPAVSKALAILDEKRSRGEIPSVVRQQFVQDLIEQMHCICGRPFTDGSPEHQKLLGLMHRSMPGSLEDDILNTASLLRGFEERSSSLQTETQITMKRRADLVDFIKTLTEELDDIGRQLKDSPLEEISNLEKKRQDFQSDIDSNNLEVGSLEERVKTAYQQLNELKRSIEKAQKTAQREQFLSKKLELAEKASDALKEMYQTFADEMRLKIEAKTKEIFQKLAWKEGHFKDIKLEPDFNLEVLDRYGLPARPELSAGERQVLSLSFITAMSRISEEEAPLVMDTPFGRLSSQHRNSITLHLPDLAGQLVLFVTDEELRDQARANLESKIGAEYRLEFDNETSCTEIVEFRV